MLKRSSTRESGNIFFVLFGAVAVVGLLGTTIVSTMRGPLSTMVEVQARTQAESEMAIASRLALLEATELANDGDCDSDGFVEPLEYADAGGAGPTGGGFLPNAISSAKIDPWGTQYGYCTWDAGVTTGAIACDIDSNATNERLDGNASSTDETYTVIAVISAGSDQIFDTTCIGGASPSISKGGDDIVVEYTYATANAASGGLWNIQSGNANVAEINKDLEVTGGATFTGGLNLTASTAQVQLGAASLLFPNESTLTTCNGANDGLIRIDTSTDPDTLQICDDPTGWVGVAGLWASGTGNDIYYNTGTPQVGIGNTSPSEALDVTGNIAASGNISAGGALNGATLSTSGNASIGGTLGVTGTTNLAALNATSAVDFDSTLNADGATTLTSTLNVTGATTLQSTLDAQGNISDSTGDLTLDDDTIITGTSDLQGNVSNSTGDITLSDDLIITGTTDAQGAISDSTGNLTLSDNVDIGNNLDVTGDIDATDITASSDLVAGATVVVNGDQLGPPSGCSSAQKLSWSNGSGWSCVTDLQGGAGGGAPSLNDLTDVIITTPAGDQCLIYNSGSGNWVNAPCEEDLSDNLIGELQNVSATGATAGQILVFGGTNWGNASLSGDATLSSGGALTISNNAIEEVMLNEANGPTDEYCLTYEASTTNFEWQTCVAAGSTVSEIDDLDDALHDTTTDFDGDTTDNDDNLALGHEFPALDGTNPGARNTAIGATALDAVTTGDSNIAIGHDAGDSITNGYENISIGVNSDSASGGTRNTAIGQSATATGTGGIAIGRRATAMSQAEVVIGANSGAGRSTGGIYNVIVGYGNFGTTGGGTDIADGDMNVIVGSNSSRFFSGDDNIFLGNEVASIADGNAASGDLNIFIGKSSGASLITGNQNILLGANTDVSGSSASHELNIGSLLFGNIDDSSTGSVNETQFGVGVTDASAINASALAEFASTTRGALFPRMTTTQRDAINSGTFATSLLVFNTTDNAYQYYDGTQWRSLLSGTGTNQLIDDLGDAFHDTTTDFDGDTTDDDDNLALGHEFPALDGTNPGARNTAIGATALSAVTTGDDNIAIGYNALNSNTTSEQNVAIGKDALSSVTDSFNTAIGSNAMSLWDDGDYNIGIGRFVAQYSNSGSRNIIMGWRSGSSPGTTRFLDNIFIGHSAGNVTGNAGDVEHNISIGAFSGSSIGSGDNNILLGYYSDVSAANASNELNIGGALFGNLSTNQIGVGVTDATAIDANAALEVTGTNLGFLPPRNADPATNITGTAGLIAYDSADNELQFYNGTAWVTLADSASTVTEIDDLSDAFHDTTTDFDGDTVDDDDNLALGHEFPALDGTNPGARNTAIGATALDSLTTGRANIAIGHNAGTTLTTANSAVFIGSNAGENITSGDSAIAIGSSAGKDATIGEHQVMIGTSAGQEATGRQNILFGFRSGFHAGVNNIGIGFRAMQELKGNENIVIGAEAGKGLNGTNTSTGNTILGSTAAQGIVNANNNLILGRNAGNIITSGSSNIVLGHNAETSAATASNELNIGGTIFGNLSTNQIGVGVADASAIDANAALDVNGTNLGFLPPRNADPATNITGTAGLIAYDSGDNELQYYNGTAWVTLADSASTVTEIDDLTDGLKNLTDNNFFLGHEGGGAIGSNSVNNTGIGINALDSLINDPATSAGDGNTAVGYNALTAVTNGHSNTALGFDAATGISSKIGNTAIGTNALRQGNTQYTTTIGSNSLANITGTSTIANTALGNHSGWFFRNGNNNTFLGESAAQGNGTNYSYDGSDNVIIGQNAAFNLDGTNDQNTIIGASTAASMTGGGSGNILLGYGVDVTSTTSSNELNIGDAIFGDLSTNQIGVGVADASAIDANAALEVTGTNLGFLPPRNADPATNITGTAGLIAYDSGDNELQYYNGTAWVTLADSASTVTEIDDLTDAFHDTTTDFDGDTVDDDDNLALGHEFPALDGTNPGARNTAIGATALDALTTGDQNVAIGESSLTSNTSGSNNLAIGYRSLESNTDGYQNSAIGESSLRSNINGRQNTALGANTLRDNSAGNFNHGFGWGALKKNIGGDYNIGIGIEALESNETGDRNTVIGTFAGQGLNDSSDVSNNLFIGDSAAINILTGADNNVILGTGAAPTLTTGASNIIIGTGADVSLAAASYELNIGGVLFGNIDDTTTGSVDETQFGVGVTDASAIDASALVEFASTERGLLPPRMTTTQRDAINSGTFATGLTVYNTTTNTLQFYNGTAWSETSAVAADSIDWDDITDTMTLDATTTIDMTAGDLNFDSGTLYIDNAGFVGIGNATPDVALDVTGDIEYSGTLTDVSDRRLKDNIAPLNAKEILARIAKIDTYSFTMKDDQKGRTEFGVMAQELENIFPELVHTAKDEMGTKSVNYVGLIAPMIEATKSLKSENDILKDQIAELQSGQKEIMASLTTMQKDMAGMKVHTGFGFEKANIQMLLIILLSMALGGACIIMLNRSRRKS